MVSQHLEFFGIGESPSDIFTPFTSLAIQTRIEIKTFFKKKKSVFAHVHNHLYTFLYLHL